MRQWFCARNLLGWIALLAVIAIPNSAFSGRASGSDTVEKTLVSLVNSPLPAGVSRGEAPSFYQPGTLYEYIDGGADVYLLYDFQRLLHQNFQVAEGELTVDVYDMGKAENAFGMYSSERSPGYKLVIIGVEGYRSDGTLNFVQDRYYVKLSASGAKATAAVDPFARMLSRRIGGTARAPALLAKFPQEHRVAHSEQYVRKDPLGHAFLAPAYIVGYTWPAQRESKLVLSSGERCGGSKVAVGSIRDAFQAERRMRGGVRAGRKRHTGEEQF